jgi:YidC/Oxa1 family membrane protein insertase
MLLQIPVMLGLYYSIQTSPDLRHAPFVGWISDLSVPDAIATFAVSLPFGFSGGAPVGFFNLNVLPVMLVVLMIWQQKLAPKPQDEQAEMMQKQMGCMMVFFGFIFYGMPAGLNLYWFVSSSLGILETKYVKKHFLPQPATPDTTTLTKVRG